MYNFLFAEEFDFPKTIGEFGYGFNKGKLLNLAFPVHFII